MITELSVDISNDPISGLKRRLVHYRLWIEAGLDMIHERRLVLYQKIEDGTPEGAYGLPILDLIDTDESLSDESKSIKKEMYKDQFIRVTTSGVYVDNNGIPVDPQRDDNGNVINAVPELQFWQSLPLSFIQPAPQTVSDAIYSLLRMSMKAQDNQGRI